jgi:hypothetical protein
LLLNTTRSAPGEPIQTSQVSHRIHTS